MNLKRILNGLAVLLPMALASQAATPTILDWQFNTGANPSSPNDSPATVNQTGGAAELSITGDIAQYHFNSQGATDFGLERGTWDTANGVFALSIQAGATSLAQPLNYTLTIDQFFDSTSGLFPGLMKFSIGNPASTSRTVLDSTPGLGQWVEDTFTWQITPSQMLQPLTLTITPDTSTGGTGDRKSVV